MIHFTEVGIRVKCLGKCGIRKMIMPASEERDAEDRGGGGDGRGRRRGRGGGAL